MSVPNPGGNPPANPPAWTFQDTVDAIEDYLADLVTRTPAETRFTAADIAAYLGWDTAVVSQALQLYRSVAAGQIGSAQAEYTIATFERGPRSTWLILTFPGMTRQQRVTAGRIMMLYAIMSRVQEDIWPYLRNLRTEHIPAVRNNRAILRGTNQVVITELQGRRSVLLTFRQDMLRVQPRNLQAAVRAVDGMLVSAIDQVDQIIQTLQAI
jgi:hypothetical protein